MRKRIFNATHPSFPFQGKTFQHYAINHHQRSVLDVIVLLFKLKVTMTKSSASSVRDIVNARQWLRHSDIEESIIMEVTIEQR